MKRTDADKQMIIDALKTAARPARDGTLYIRTASARRIMKKRACQFSAWINQGRIAPMRFKVPRSKSAPFGMVTALPLDAVVECIGRRWCHWTDEEDGFLVEHLGLRDHDWIASKLGRTRRAIKCRAVKLGVNQTNAQNLLTPGDIAGICRRSREAVRNWCLYKRKPLKYSTIQFGRRHVKLIKAKDLKAFLDQHPIIWESLPIASRQAVERMTKNAPTPEAISRKLKPKPMVYRRSAA